VGSVIAFTGVFLAKAIGFWGISPLVAFPLVLVMGCAFGAFMGLLIDALKIPAFIITLAGMFFLRGVSYLVSEESIPINHPVYDTLSGLSWLIPGGGRLSAMGLLMLGVVVIGIFLAHRTRFGNEVYAIGGSATSANLMGISTRSTPFVSICSRPGWRRWQALSFLSIPRRVMRWPVSGLNWMRLPRW
jgi:simple sugar transport system permease protein